MKAFWFYGRYSEAILFLFHASQWRIQDLWKGRAEVNAQWRIQDIKKKKGGGHLHYGVGVLSANMTDLCGEKPKKGRKGGGGGFGPPWIRHCTQSQNQIQPSVRFQMSHTEESFTKLVYISMHHRLMYKFMWTYMCTCKLNLCAIFNYIIGGFELIFMNLLKSAAFSLHTSNYNSPIG